MFYTLNQLLNIHNQTPLYCIFENRPPKFKFSIKNYGEVLGNFINKADGDPWDIFAPGYTKTLSFDKPYKIKKIIGILFLENGNHKIAVQLYAPGFKESLVNSQINMYSKKYCNFKKLTGNFLYII
tara:strand:+ start:1133 stop:1510 length:378 start_codon:yes stop_codon:yes gene_type:complete